MPNIENQATDFVLYAQHGWADTAQDISQLARELATPKTHIVTPNLGWVKTWLLMEPLIEQVEANFKQTIANYPYIPIRIIGHSMGGLIWLEVLNRNRELWLKIHSLVLIGSPVGGADLARIIDPLGIGIGIARDLSQNRRPMAESIAKFIPTLAIAGDTDNGSDGLITVFSTKFSHSKKVCLPGISHPALKNHPSLVKIIQDFWGSPVITLPSEPEFSDLLIDRLHSTPGMTDAHRRDFKRSKVYITFNNGITIRTWKNPVGVDHVFVANSEGDCLYSGFVGWIHAIALRQTLKDIAQQYARMLA